MDLCDKFADQIREKTHLYSMMNHYFPKKAISLLVFLFFAYRTSLSANF
jgi:hypothetical protein